MRQGLPSLMASEVALFDWRHTENFQNSRAIVVRMSHLP
jgi:hypothetical protein